METISNSSIEEALRPYGASLTLGVADKIRAYISLLQNWNKTISLTTVTKPIEILKFHFGESIFAASAADFSESRLADVGSGAGFPGIPLALVIPGLDVTLIESNAKKCAFLSEVVRELKLQNVAVFLGRMQDFPRGSQEFNFVAARALGQHLELLAWAKDHVEPGGNVVLWLGLSDSQDISLNPDWRWQPAKLIPGSERRYILIGSLRE